MKKSRRYRGYLNIHMHLDLDARGLGSIVALLLHRWMNEDYFKTLTSWDFTLYTLVFSL